MDDISTRHILIVEDDETKYLDILAVVQTRLIDALIERAATIKAAERMLDKATPDLLVLDISMNIAEGSLGPMRGGFANLGGIDLLERMYHLGSLCPTIIVTGFDAFRAGGRRERDYEMMDLTELTALAKGRLGEDFIDLVRYSSRDWRTHFESALDTWRER